MSAQPLAIRRVNTRHQDAQPAIDALREQLSPRGDVVSPAGRQRTIDVFGKPLTPVQVVERICTDVERDGLKAVLDYTRRIDGAELTAATIRVPADELAAAHAQADRELLATVRRIRDHVLRFQTAILHHDVRVDTEHGSYLRQRYTPLRRVGICVPGGAAAYPSTVLMTAVPAQAAGVGQIAVVAPPTPFGAYNTDLLATCHEIGVREVYRLGGAQAVAAMAYGVEGLPRVDKIVGPGSLFVALAKKFVFGDVDIDSIAGPSEVVVLADDTARPEFVALDLIAQAEHDPGASILITWTDGLIERVSEELQRQLARLSRGEAARRCLEAFGAMIQCRDADEAVRLTNLIAPEHLHITTRDAEALLERIDSAGAAFLGNHSPVAMGDYTAGPSHVLPTGGTARFASGLSANDFLRPSSVIAYTAAGMQVDAPDVQVMADVEGLTAHRASVDVRLDAADADTAANQGKR
ncbi:MAG: histidinol dehydrogenase [Planctomycetales bacterium]|nr:histidinol dehydrogenase [Planctomycetales bacterium]